MYEDLGLLTTDEAIGDNVANLFNNLSGFSRKPSYDELLVAPHSVRSGLIERIRGEVAHHREGRPALIRFKANSIVDEAIIDELYRASRAGVPICTSSGGNWRDFMRSWLMNWTRMSLSSSATPSSMLSNVVCIILRVRSVSAVRSCT